MSDLATIKGRQDTHLRYRFDAARLSADRLALRGASLNEKEVFRTKSISLKTDNRNKLHKKLIKNISKNWLKTDEKTMQNEMEKKQIIKPKRRWKSDSLPRVFTVRATDDEYNKLKKMAEKTGWSVSRLLVEATLHVGVRPAEEVRAEREVFEELIFEVRRIGINLNQITYALNAAHRGHGEPPKQSDLERSLQSIESILTKLRKRL